eukprot:CAMPEP_0182486022 /NCGR_PEP_ID=MMETSP1319-20130603/46300_1 /TAXON_ID=172717 /ORGANISM="Bolidomonas pacifica, Strain RCC208" /LENGTH=473 /DNA_ID=CAMNT_0024688073 /DNA_START=5 /DNA_END=1422 /DNA_ORIENTATION=+
MKEIQKQVESGQRSSRSLLRFAYKASLRSGKIKYKNKKTKRVQEAEDLEEMEKKFNLKQALTYDVLLDVMTKWEEDEKMRKSLAHETSPPRRSSLVKTPLKRELIEIEYPHDDEYDDEYSPPEFRQDLNLSAMTDPKLVIRQFLDECSKKDSIKVGKWSKDEVRKSLEDQMAERRHIIMSTEVKRSGEAVQGLSDRLEALNEIGRYFEETIADEDPPDPKTFTPELKKVAETLLGIKRELRKRQKRRMTISSKRPILPKVEEMKGDAGKKYQFQLMLAKIEAGESINMDDLFNLVDGDGDGSIDEEEWGMFLQIRRAMQQKSIDERNKLLETQEKLKERMKRAPPEVKENERRHREYAERKKGMEEKIQNMMKHNQTIKEKIKEVEMKKKAASSDDKPTLQVEKFSKLILSSGVDDFERILNGAVQDDSDDEDEYVSHSALKLTLSMMNIDHKQFNLKDIVYFFGKYTKGMVT